MNFDSDLTQDVLARFLRYVQIDTQSDGRSESFPSTEKQLNLLKMLAKELRQLGVTDVREDEHGYVMATLPSTLADGAEVPPTIGLLAHVDTSPEVSGANVKPQVLKDYDGGVIAYPGDPELRLSPKEFPALAAAKGHTVVTSDGTTLLGGDNKAGVAEIMTAVAYLQAHREIGHGPLAVAFTPDEEIGKGTLHFDLKAFGADYAYTMDGGAAGILQAETFSADSAEVVVKGNNQHPGYAKGKMVNALKLAAAFMARLPLDRLSPETTEGREGYVHPVRFEGTVEEARIQFILRDFDDDKLLEQRKLLQDLAEEARALDPRAEFRLTYSESYRNMRRRLEEVPFVTAHAETAMRRVGLTPFSEPVRGGTDGSRLTEMGLPTPNLFTGAYNYHSRREWVDVEEMVMSVQTIVYLAQVWAEHPSR
jgi:tripeptide aminopeptidase